MNFLKTLMAVSLLAIAVPVFAADTTATVKRPADPAVSAAREQVKKDQAVLKADKAALNADRKAVNKAVGSKDKAGVEAARVQVKNSEAKVKADRETLKADTKALYEAKKKAIADRKAAKAAKAAKAEKPAVK